VPPLRLGCNEPPVQRRDRRAAFTSPYTVDYYPRKVFTKLQIGSRTELQRALPSERQTALVS